MPTERLGSWRRRRPTTCAARCWRVTIDAQAAAVGPGVGDGADDLLFASAEQGGAHGSGGDPDQKNVVKSYPIEAVFESENSLYFVCFDHGVENIANGERFPSGSRQDNPPKPGCRQIIRRMTPFGGEPGIVKVEPTNHRADVEGMHRIELPIGARNTGSIC